MHATTAITHPAAITHAATAITYAATAITHAGAIMHAAAVTHDHQQSKKINFELTYLLLP